MKVFQFSYFANAWRYCAFSNRRCQGFAHRRSYGRRRRNQSCSARVFHCAFGNQIATRQVHSLLSIVCRRNCRTESSSEHESFARRYLIHFCVVKFHPFYHDSLTNFPLPPSTFFYLLSKNEALLQTSDLPFVRRLKDFNLLVFLSQHLDINSDMPTLCHAVDSEDNEEVRGFELLINSLAGIQI